MFCLNRHNSLNPTATVGMVIAVMLYVLRPFPRRRRPRRALLERHTPDDGPRVLPGLLSPEECAQLIAYCRGQPDSFWSSSLVWAAKGIDPTVRESMQGWLSPGAHPVVARLSAEAVRLSGLPASHQEPLQMVRYRPGGHFVAHHDACDPNTVDTCSAMNQGAGPRRTTLLVYLNDTDGGETEFWPRGRDGGSILVQPHTGTGVLFVNSDGGDDSQGTDPEGRVRPGSLHRAHPVRTGEKWIATIWTHARPWISNR